MHEDPCERAPLSSPLSLFLVLFSLSPKDLWKNPREEVVAGERDLSSGSLCPQSCSGRRAGNISQALRASPERKASICLSEGNGYLSVSGRTRGQGWLCIIAVSQAQRRAGAGKVTD